MPAPLFADGDRPIDGVLNNPISPSDWNDMSDEQKNAYKAQYVPAIMGIGFSMFDTGPTVNGWEGVFTDPPHLFIDTGTADSLYLTIPVRAGGAITRIRGLIKGTSTAGTDGSIKLVRAKRAIIGGPAADTLVSIPLVGAVTLDFDLLAGFSAFDHAIDTLGDASDKAELVKDDHIYYFEAIAPDGGGGNEAFIYQLGVMYSLAPVTGAV